MIDLKNVLIGRENFKFWMLHIANIIWTDDQYSNSIHYSCRSNMNSLYMWRSNAMLNLLISSAYGSQFPPLHKVFFFTCKIFMEDKLLARQMKTCKSSTDSLIEKLFPSTITFFFLGSAVVPDV